MRKVYSPDELMKMHGPIYCRIYDNKEGCELDGFCYGTEHPYMPYMIVKFTNDDKLYWLHDERFTVVLKDMFYVDDNE